MNNMNPMPLLKILPVVYDNRTHAVEFPLYSNPYNPHEHFTVFQDERAFRTFNQDLGKNDLVESISPSEEHDYFLQRLGMNITDQRILAVVGGLVAGRWLSNKPKADPATNETSFEIDLINKDKFTQIIDHSNAVMSKQIIKLCKDTETNVDNSTSVFVSNIAATQTANITVNVGQIVEFFNIEKLDIQSISDIASEVFHDIQTEVTSAISNNTVNDIVQNMSSYLDQSMLGQLLGENGNNTIANIANIKQKIENIVEREFIDMKKTVIENVVDVNLVRAMKNAYRNQFQVHVSGVVAVSILFLFCIFFITFQRSLKIVWSFPFCVCVIGI